MVAGFVPAGDDVVERRESRVRSYCRTYDAVFVRASGSVMYDRDERPYLDFLAGAGSLNYGHNDPDLKAALLEYIEHDGVAHTLDLVSEAKRSFLVAFERLVLAPRGMRHVVQFTGPTGTNAVEAALKIARKATGRMNVIAFTNAFHGVSQGSLAATGNAHHRSAASVPLTNVTRVPFDGYLGPHIDTSVLLERLLDDPSSGVDPPAAVLLETVQGEGGCNVASVEWLRRVASIARAAGAVLILDDVQAGCGRTGRFFSFEESGVVPDIVVLSKSLSGYGLPMAVVLIEPDLDVWEPGEHNGTFRGNAHAFVTARAALEKFWSDASFVDDIEYNADVVTGHLDDIACVLPGARVKGRGMMQRIDVGASAAANDIVRGCFEAGLIVETCGPHDEVVKVLAPLTTSPDELDEGLGILRRVVERNARTAFAKGA
jgi:diaminobutyrate-2-oxoglutarate transaminase